MSFLNKLSNIKIGRKTLGQKEVLNNYNSREVITILEKKLLIILETILKCYLMQITMLNKMKLREKDLKY